MKQLNETQEKKMDEIHTQFKLDLKEADIEEDDFKIMCKGKDDEQGNLKNSIQIGGFEVRSNASSLKEVEDCMCRFLDKFKGKMPEYIG